MERAARTVFVVTANRTADGGVVYLDAQGRWSPSFEQAHVLDDAARRDELVAWGKTREGEVCGCYAIEIGVTPSGERRLSMRERLRAAGPEDVVRRLGYAPVREAPEVVRERGAA